MKRTIAMILAVVMILALSMSTVVFADDSATTATKGSITVTNAQPGETYTAYKMFDLVQNADLSAFTYTVNERWADFFKNDGVGAQFITVNNAGAVTEIKDANGDVAKDAMDLAKAAAAALDGKPIAGFKEAEGEKAVIDNLDPGYYLIVSSNGTIAMIDTTPTKPDQTIAEKNPIPSVDKNVQEDSTGEYGKKNDAQIGDTVNFKTVIKAYKGAKNYVLHDVMDKGLTLNVNSIKVEGLTKGQDYSIKTENLTDGCTFEVQFIQDYLNKITAETELTVTYSAVLNNTAVVAVPEINKTKLTWGNKSTTKWVETKTYTYKFEVLKYAAGDEAKKNLAGAEFKLQKGGVDVNLVKLSDTQFRVATAEDENTVTTFTTVAGNNIEIYGLDDDDDYTLVETKAPDGYNMLTAPVTVTITPDDPDTDKIEFDTIEVANDTGTELPSTGGVGTTLLVTFGALLFMTTAVVLVTKKRMYNEGC